MAYDYDVLGEMTKVRENGATSGAGVLASYSYDDLGNRIGAAYGNGTTSSWTPDAVSRLHQLAHNLAGTNADLTRTFTYNPAGGIASATSSNDAYAWGAAANVNRNYTANGLNQYTASGSTSLSYDTRGNLTTSGVDSYTYSSENLMRTGPGNTSLAYDPLLRLYQVAKGSSTTRFAYDGLEMVGEYNASNVLQMRYVYGPGTDEPIVQYSGTGTTSRIWLMADERGSVIALTDSSGNRVAIDTYDEHGIPGSGNSGRFQYTGQAWLPEIGMYYYKARMYSPSLGRFMQTDPIGYADGLNWYNYVGGDPVNFVDPMGLCGGAGETRKERDTPCVEIVVTANKFDSENGRIFGGSSSGGASIVDRVSAAIEQQNAKPSDIVVIAHRKKVKSGTQYTLIWGYWVSPPPNSDAKWIILRKITYIVKGHSGICSGTVSGTGVAKGAAKGAVGGTVGWLWKLGVGALAGAEGGPAGSLIGAAIAISGGAVGGAAGSAFGQACLGG